METWLVYALPLIGLVSVAIGNYSQRGRNVQIGRSSISAQVVRGAVRDRDATHLRPSRWYDSAIAVGFLSIPVCQWIGVRYTWSLGVAAAPLAIFATLHVLVSVFHPTVVRPLPFQVGKRLSYIAVTGAALALTAFAPLTPILAVTRIALLDTLVVMIAILGIAWRWQQRLATS
jgi:dipeptide/tripeptide permease